MRLSSLQFLIKCLDQALAAVSPKLPKFRTNGLVVSFVRKEAQFCFNAITLGLRGNQGRINYFRGPKHKTLLPQIRVIQNINIINHKKFFLTELTVRQKQMFIVVYLSSTFKKFPHKSRRGSKTIVQLVLFFSLSMGRAIFHDVNTGTP